MKQRKKTPQKIDADTPYGRISNQHFMGGLHDTVATIKDQDKTPIKQKIRMATQKRKMNKKKKKIEKYPRDQLYATQAALASKKDKVKAKVYKKYGNEDMNKCVWFRFETKEVVQRKDSFWLRVNFKK